MWFWTFGVFPWSGKILTNLCDWRNEDHHIQTEKNNSNRRFRGQVQYLFINKHFFGKTVWKTFLTHENLIYRSQNLRLVEKLKTLRRAPVLRKLIVRLEIIIERNIFFPVLGHISPHRFDPMTIYRTPGE